jgi:dihydrofolate synthase/folylpolyglutamate synthase
MDYAEAQRYILSLTDYEKIPGAFAAANFDPRRMEALLRPLGDPHRSGSFVHIAGSKGKGSTAVMIASALTAAGYRTGLFTSPHLHTIRERIRIDGSLITPGELAALTERVKPAAEKTGAGPWGVPSTFEVLAAVAFLRFRQAGAVWSVLEAGLGGRLDATNVVTPRVAVITSISYDHTDVLGPTLTHIAREKAGIIKPGVPVVLAPQPGGEEVVGVIRDACHERGCPLTQVGKEVAWWLLSATLEGQRLRVAGRRGSYELSIPLLGEHQQENAATAVAALERLMDDAPGLTPQAVARGLGAVSWPGRLQVVGHNPLMMVDGAHNADSARRLRQALGQLPYRRLVLVMAVSRDKDMAGMVRELAPLHPRVIATHSCHPRALPACHLTAEWAKYSPAVEEAGDVAGALARARALAAEEDMVLATGSLFVVAEVLEELGVAQREEF